MLHSQVLPQPVHIVPLGLNNYYSPLILPLARVQDHMQIQAIHNPQVQTLTVLKLPNLSSTLDALAREVLPISVKKMSPTFFASCIRSLNLHAVQPSMSTRQPHNTQSLHKTQLYYEDRARGRIEITMWMTTIMAFFLATSFYDYRQS